MISYNNTRHRAHCAGFNLQITQQVDQTRIGIVCVIQDCIAAISKQQSFIKSIRPDIVSCYNMRNYTPVTSLCTSVEVKLTRNEGLK